MSDSSRVSQTNDPKLLERIAYECRLDIITMLEKAGSGHPGGSLSVIDLLVGLFFSEMEFDASNTTSDDRDRCILSKGHGVPALYSVFSKLGILPKEELWTLRKLGSRLQGHPDRVRLPLVEASTGSLGQGLSIAQGLALGLRLKGASHRVFCVMGDGEVQEGQVWEAAMSAPKFHLGNLVAIVDCNNGQIDGHVEQVMSLKPFPDKWRAFNWAVEEIDGHDFPQILGALQRSRSNTDRPTAILARTVKGKGVSFMENDIGWHGVTPNADQANKARSEINKKISALG